MRNEELNAIIGFALTLVFLMIIGGACAISFLKPSHRLQSLLAPLIRRLAVTAGLLIGSGPAAALTDEAWIYDIAALAFACWYWYVFLDRYFLAPDALARRRAEPVAERPPVAMHTVEPDEAF